MSSLNHGREVQERTMWLRKFTKNKKMFLSQELQSYCNGKIIRKHHKHLILRLIN